MNRKLKKFLKLLTYQVKSEQKEIFEHNGYMYVLYSFILRYQAIRRDYDLPELRSDIRKYIKNMDKKLYPYDDIVHPFFIFIDDINKGNTGNFDYRSYFGFPLDVESVEPESVFNFLNLANRAGIEDWSQSSFTETEYDIFFKKLIQNISSKIDEWIRVYPEELAEFVDFILPNNRSVFYLGDEKADLAVKRINKDTESFLTGHSSNIFWYYLRPILFGEKKLQLRLSEFRSLAELDTDIVVGHIPFGNLGKDFPKEIRNLSKTLEDFYLSLLIKKLKDSNGLGLFLLPQSFLYQNKKEIIELRKKLIESGILKTIIRFPEGLFAPMTSVSYVMLIIDYSSEKNTIQFIDGYSISSKLDPNDQKMMNSFFEQLKSYYYVDSFFFSIAKNVNKKEIEKNNYSLAVTNYLNVLDDGYSHNRFGDEELWSFFDVFEPIKLKTIRTPELGKFIGPSDLHKTIENIELRIDKNSKVKRVNGARVLNTTAILISIWDGCFRFGYFEHKGEDIFLLPSVKAFDRSTDHNINYLALELFSDFVYKQLQKNESKSTFSVHSESTIKNIFLRIPSKNQQAKIYNNAIQEIAKNRLAEIENLHDSIKYIEKDVFASFAHDFGKLLLKVSSNIDSLEQYLKSLDKQGIIQLSDSILGEKIADRGQSVDDLLLRIKSNHDQVINFLKSEVNIFTGDKSKFEIFDLGKLIFQWIMRQDMRGYKILLSERDSLLNIETVEEISQSYKVYGSKNQVYKILNNFLDNAIKHGFIGKNESYEFRLHLEKRLHDYNRLQQVSLHVANNGIPFPDDFTCEDFFKRKHAGPNSDGEGLGGYSIKRAVENMDAEIRCSSSFLLRQKFPVLFQIIFKKIEL